MDLNQVEIIEARCLVMTFEESTADVPHLRPVLQGWPSEIVQARIEFDHVSRMELSSLTLLEIVRVSKLKRELMITLYNTSFKSSA